VPWDPQLLGRIRHLRLVARRVTDALLSGSHRSRRVGEAVEFADYQAYQPGMDPRHIDYKVEARTDRLVVRRMEAETRIPSVVVLDLSGDLATRGGRGELPGLEDSKAGRAVLLAATFMMWVHRQGEPVGLEIIGANTRVSMPIRGGRSHLSACFAALAEARPGGRASLEQALLDLGRRIRRRSLVAVISDGMEEPGAWIPSLAAFARRGADLRFFHLLDFQELRFDYSAPARFESPETGVSIQADPAGLQADFLAVGQEWYREVRDGVAGQGGQHVAFDLHGPLFHGLVAAIRGLPSPETAPWT